MTSTHIFRAMPTNVLPALPPHTLRILHIGDHSEFADHLREHLAGQGCAVTITSAGKGLVGLLQQLAPQVVLLDCAAPGEGSLALVRYISARHPETRVIVLSDAGSEQLAVDAVKAGAADYLCLPVNASRVWQAVQHSLISPALLPCQSAALHGIAALRGGSLPMQRLRDHLGMIARADLQLGAAELPTILITGEPGTPKTQVARALHADGPRHLGLFICVKCTADTLAEPGAIDELITLAQGGTLFFDNVEHLTLVAQARLAQALDRLRSQGKFAGAAGTPPIRFMAASSADLKHRMLDGLFRADLYYLHLGALHVRLPALRERRDDIATLATSLLRELRKRRANPHLEFSAEALAALQGHDWQGNDTELGDVVVQAINTTRGNLITPEFLLLVSARSSSSAAHRLH